MKKITWLDQKLLRFLLVGVANTLVGAGVMFALYNLLGVGYWISSAANYLVGGILSFFLNKYFTFGNKERSASQVLRFILTVSLCYLAAYGLAKPLVRLALASFSETVRDNVAMLCGMGLYTLLGYFGQRFFAFRSEGASSLKLPRHIFPIVWLALVLALECLVFNAPSYHLLGSDYEQTELSLSDAAIGGGELTDGRLTSNSTSVTLEWKGLDRPVGTLALDLTLTDTATASLLIDATDDTNSAYYRYGVASATLIAGNERSHTTVLRLSGDLHDLRLTLTLPENATLSIDSVSVNKAVPMRFSPLRCGALYLIGLFFWMMFTLKALRQTCAERAELFSASTWCVTLICLTVALVMVVLYSTAHSNGLISEFTLTSGNQITQEIVDAFEKGQVHLLTEPTEELLAMDNPYDWSARVTEGVYYLWDHCLYDGHYYSYYGISLVLLLFLPYHLLTGYYFSSIIAIFLCGSLGILFLSLTYRTFVRKFFPNIPIRLALVGLITLQLSSGVWFCFCAANFYEIAQASGFLFVTMGAYFLLSSNVIGAGKLSPVRIALATSSLSLAVLSRPTTAVYCVVALVFLFFGFQKALASYRESRKKGSLIAFLLTATLPFAFFGGIQMVYNYLRFDSLFDFGIQYSLTINDFTRSQFHARFVSIGLYNYLLAPPVITPDFPYVTSSFRSLSPNGYYFIANYYAVGLIWRALPLLGLCLAPKALKRLDKKDRPKAIALIGSLSLAAPFAVLFSIWESGYGVRYAVDFGWEMVIGALAILFFLYEKCRNEGVRSLCDKAAIVSLLPTLVINFALAYTFLKAEMRTVGAQRFFAELESIFNFWH